MEYVSYVGVAVQSKGIEGERVCRSDAFFVDVLVQMYGAVHVVMCWCAWVSLLVNRCLQL